MSILFNNFVAVVDSGVGGLTVLSKLRRDYPQCRYLYLADSAYCPYGTKSDDEIFARLQTVFDWLVAQHVSAVVLACNTASVFAPKLRLLYDVPIYDVIVPTCSVALHKTHSRRVALLATDATVRSGVYGKLLNSRGVSAASFPCSSLVPYVEQGKTDTPDCERAVRLALLDFNKADADTVILGCTHFPLLRSVIEPHVAKAAIVECVTDFAPPSSVSLPGEDVFVTTGAVAAKSASVFYRKAHFIHIDI